MATSTIPAEAKSAQSIVRRLGAGEFEFGLSAPQHAYYSAERAICHALFRRPPPRVGEAPLLNLGCGPHNYPGWVNADDYAPKRRLRERAFRPDWSLDITRSWRCPANHWGGIFTEHVLEHVTYAQAMRVLSEALRTLRPAAWIRISVPDLARYARYYQAGGADHELGDFPHPAVAISFLTQMHLHRSAWDGDLLTQALGALGFADARVVSFGHGADARLVKDDPDKAHESLYVEARKP